MVDELAIRKLRNMLGSMSRLPAWSSLSKDDNESEGMSAQLKVAIWSPVFWSGYKFDNDIFNTKSPVYIILFPYIFQNYPNIVQDLTNTFLHIISGGEPVKLVEVTICVNLFLSHHAFPHTCIPGLLDGS